MIKKLILAAGLFALTLHVSAQNEAINNQTILDLLKEGFKTEEIKGAIENCTERSITYSLDYMRQLKAAGADAELTTYIQKIAKADFGYEGVMLWNPNNSSKPVKLLRTQFEKESKGFNLGTIAAIGAASYMVGSAVSGDIHSGTAAAVTAGTGVLMSSGKDIQKLMLPGSTSKCRISGESGKHPVFRFYFPKTENNSFEKSANNWYEMIMSAIQSPNEFQCVKMQVKTKKDGNGRRLFPDKMSYTVLGFEGSNASTRQIINFDVKDINNSTFEVSFPQALEPGEYVFFYKSGLNSESFKEHPFGFDFTVTE
jgi:hypothetical protein